MRPSRTERRAAALAASVVAASALVYTQNQGQPPIFRAGTLLVRVDAYPSRDGKIVPSLSADDFEILENGRPQKIENFEYIVFDKWTPEGERRDPNSERESFDLAADPRYRIFVIFLDTSEDTTVRGSHDIRVPLIDFLHQVLGPRDLFGVMTPQNSVRDLVLGQRTESIEEQLTRDWAWGDGHLGDEGDRRLEMCRPKDLEALRRRRRADEVYSRLEELIARLGDLRQERKNIVLVSNGLSQSLPNIALVSHNQKPVPKIGVKNGRIHTGQTDQIGTERLDETFCAGEIARLANIDFAQRFLDLIAAARRANVSVYPITPSGLQAAVTYAGIKAIQAANEGLRTLAENTDGVAIVDTNDLGGGMRRIGDDLAAYYLLGYYTTNTNWDGGLRKITVRLRSSGATIRARREYRVPTAAEMAARRGAPAPSPADNAGVSVDRALGTLARITPSVSFVAYGSALPDGVTIVAELTDGSVRAGRWKSGGQLQAIVTNEAGETVATAGGRFEPGARSARLVATPPAPGPWRVVVRLRGSADADDAQDRFSVASSSLVADPIVYRASAGSARSAAAAFEFSRTERLHIEWSVLQTLDRREARLLGRNGQPLPIAVDLRDSTASGDPVLSADLALAPLAAGEYLLELTAGAGATAERKLLAFRVVP
jgi:VWFA-related protein